MINFADPQMLALGILAIPGIYLMLTRDSTSRKIIGGTKALTVILLALALAAPSITVQEERNQRPQAVVLQDDSRSTELIEKPELDFDDVRTVERTIASGNRSDLRSGILQNIDEDRSYILISDLQSSSNMDDVARQIRRRNATVHVLKPDIETDSAVQVRGPDTTYPGAENTYVVEVSSTETSPKPEVQLNGNSVSLNEREEGVWTFTRSFDDQGFNTITASIDSSDRFSDNNRYFKTVEVAEKPEILVLGDEGRISQEFGDFYSFTHRDSLPDDLSEYYAVIAKKQFDESALAGYTATGNGLIFTGDYEQQNQILPLKKVSKQQQSEGAKIVLAIDISYSSGSISEGFRESQQVAKSLVHTMPRQTKVGVLAYRQQPNVVNPIVSLGDNRERLKDKIDSLDTDGRSRHDNGLKGAVEMLNGTGNVVLITDGTGVEEGTGSIGESTFTYNEDERENSLEIASEMEENLIVIGTGNDTNEEFLNDLADAANGQYLDPGDAGRLNFKFAGGGTESRAERLYVVDKSHFITRSIEAQGTASAFDTVEAKRGASTLVTSDQGKPFLTTWRYGIGRVAAYSGGSKDLGAVMYQDSQLVSRSLSWAVGAPQRKEDRWLEIEDGQKGEKVEVRASYPIEGLNRQGDDLYTGTIEVSDTGVHSFNGSLYSYNYNDEIAKVGYNDVESFAANTGGRVFTPDQSDEIAEEIKSFSDEKVSKERDIADYFLAAALLVFLSEIGYRKRRGKK